MSKLPSKQHDLSYPARKLLGRMQPNALLRCQAVMGEDPQYFWIDPPGRRVGPAGARELINKGRLIPCGDGLFPGFDQSFKLRS